MKVLRLNISQSLFTVYSRSNCMVMILSCIYCNVSVTVRSNCIAVVSFILSFIFFELKMIILLQHTSLCHQMYPPSCVSTLCSDAHSLCLLSVLSQKALAVLERSSTSGLLSRVPLCSVIDNHPPLSHFGL